MTKVTCLVVCLIWLVSSASGSVVKNTVEDHHESVLDVEPAAAMQVTTSAIIRNCGCLMMTSEPATVGRRYLPRSLAAPSRDVICSAFCDHLSGSHFATNGNECLCFDRPADAIDCEEVEAPLGGDTVAELKCVDRPRPRPPNPTRRNTVSGSVLTFLRNMEPPTRAQGGNRYRGLEQDLLQFEDEIQRRSRHTLDSSRQRDNVPIVSAPAATAKDTVSTKTSTQAFGPSKSVGLAATLILLAFVCIFTMGLKTWYHTRRKKQKESEVQQPEAKKDIDWEKIMSY